MQGWHQPNHDLQGFQWPHLGEGNPCKSINLRPGGTWEQTSTNFSCPYSFPCVRGLEVISFLSEYGQLSSVLGDRSVVPLLHQVVVSQVSLALLFQTVSMLHFVSVGEGESTREAADSAGHINCAVGTQGSPSNHKTCGTQWMLWTRTHCCFVCHSALGGILGLGCALLGWQR